MTALAGTNGDATRISSGGTTYTVPSDATGVYALVITRSNSITITSITLSGNSDLTQVAFQQGSGYAPSAALYYGDVTATGSRTGQINYSSFPANGYSCVFVHVKDLPAAPVTRGSTVTTEPSTYASGTVTSESNDIILAMHGRAGTVVDDVAGWTLLLNEGTTDIKAKVFALTSGAGSPSTTFDPNDLSEVGVVLAAIKGTSGGSAPDEATNWSPLLATPEPPLVSVW